jgi:hypothetical protein
MAKSKEELMAALEAIQEIENATTEQLTTQIDTLAQLMSEINIVESEEDKAAFQENVITKAVIITSGRFFMHYIKNLRNGTLDATTEAPKLATLVKQITLLQQQCTVNPIPTDDSFTALETGLIPFTQRYQNIANQLSDLSTAISTKNLDKLKEIIGTPDLNPPTEIELAKVALKLALQRPHDGANHMIGAIINGAYTDLNVFVLDEIAQEVCKDAAPNSDLAKNFDSVRQYVLRQKIILIQQNAKSVDEKITELTEMIDSIATDIKNPAYRQKCYDAITVTANELTDAQCQEEMQVVGVLTALKDAYVALTDALPEAERAKMTQLEQLQELSPKVVVQEVAAAVVDNVVAPQAPTTTLTTLLGANAIIEDIVNGLDADKVYDIVQTASPTQLTTLKEKLQNYPLLVDIVAVEVAVREVYASEVTKLAINSNKTPTELGISQEKREHYNLDKTYEAAKFKTYKRLLFADPFKVAEDDGPVTSGLKNIGNIASLLPKFLLAVVTFPLSLPVLAGEAIEEGRNSSRAGKVVKIVKAAEEVRDGKYNETALRTELLSNLIVSQAIESGKTPSEVVNDANVFPQLLETSGLPEKPTLTMEKLDQKVAATPKMNGFKRLLLADPLPIQKSDRNLATIGKWLVNKLALLPKLVLAVATAPVAIYALNQERKVAKENYQIASKLVDIEDSCRLSIENVKQLDDRMGIHSDPAQVLKKIVEEALVVVPASSQVVGVQQARGALNSVSDVKVSAATQQGLKSVSMLEEVSGSNTPPAGRQRSPSSQGKGA